MAFSDEYLYRFSGIQRLYGLEGLKKIHSARILMIGLGGVGSWCAEALARSGVGHIGLMDFDDICISNTNRQLHANQDSVGQLKTRAMENRLLAINPDLQVSMLDEAYSRENENSIFSDNSYDVIVDGIDDADAKFHLILACRERQIPLVVSGAAGGRVDPAQIQWSDLSQSREDQMLALLRKRLRRKAGFPRKGSMGIPCVYSIEKPVYLNAEGQLTQERPADFKKPLDCSTGFGTATQITGSFGFQLAHLALKALL